MKNKRNLIGLLLIVGFVLISGCVEEKPEEKPSDSWAEIRANDVAILSDGWSQPKRIEVSDDGWEDGVYISSDGNTLYFVYYPGDILADLKAGKFKDDIDVYYSIKPFTSKKKHAISEDIWSEGGVMISGSDMYYMSNKPIDDNDKNYDDNIYKNGELLTFNTNQSEGDPHHCSAKNELYFWINKEEVTKEIYVYKNNHVSKLPEPINDGHENIQPFLTPDCQTMYFTSNRDGGVLKIYKSQRLGEDSWSNPKIVVSSKYGVGEPTLTDDGKFLFFVQLFKSEDGNSSTTDIFYSEKLS
ncbi:MAG: hypothetical protein AB1391_01920 [Candidatus Micrarchaeota archaeon]